MRLMVKCAADVAQERRYSRAASSQSSLSTMIASVGPSPKVRKRSNTRRIEAMLASISLVGEQLAALVLARRIADLGRAAAHQHDRLVPGLLQPAQHHDLDQAADVEARRGRVEADIGRRRPPSPPAHRAPRRRSPGGYSRARRAGGGGRIDTRSCTARLASCRGRCCKRVPLRGNGDSGMRCTLSIRHPDTPPAGAVQGLGERRPFAALGAIGDDQHLVRRRRRRPRFVIPPPAEPRRADELWQTTCFEAFVRGDGERLSRIQFLAVGRMGGL